MQTTLRLFLDWGIEFKAAYEIEERAHRRVAYADKQELEEEIIRRHHGNKNTDTFIDDSVAGGGMQQTRLDTDFRFREHSEEGFSV